MLPYQIQAPGSIHSFLFVAGVPLPMDSSPPSLYSWISQASPEWDCSFFLKLRFWRSCHRLKPDYHWLRPGSPISTASLTATQDLSEQKQKSQPQNDTVKLASLQVWQASQVTVCNFQFETTAAFDLSNYFRWWRSMGKYSERPHLWWHRILSHFNLLTKIASAKNSL